MQALRVYPMSFGEAATRRTITRSLCPPEGIGALSPFFKEITFRNVLCHPNAAVHHRSEETSNSTNSEPKHHFMSENLEFLDDENFWRVNDDDVVLED